MPEVGPTHELSDEEKRQLAELAQRDRQVRAHEAAHKAAAGALAFKTERERLASELGRRRTNLPTLEELKPLLRERLRDLEATLRADVPRGRLALGTLLDGKRLRIYAHGRIEGVATLTSETL
jgi:hypothetical protein